MNSGDKACDVRSKIFGIKIRIELLAFSIAFSAGKAAPNSYLGSFIFFGS